MPELPMVGDEFAGYRLRSVLGRGGMSAVYQAENPRLGNVIALKILAPELAADDVFRTRFLEESRIAAAMNHPHVIPIHDMGSSGGLLYIAMRCVAGTDLRQMISKRGRLQPDMAVFLLTQAARALDAAHHRGLVHRDVKPGNLLIERGNEDGDPDHLYLADFGITKTAMSRSGLSSSGQFLGTLDYVAPEQIRGMAVLGMADQYSLGCVLYECLTGRVPFEKDLDAAIIWAHVEEQPTRPTLLRPDLPPAVDEVFARVLAKQPGDRYENCREFMAEARAALGDMAVPPPARGSAGAGRRVGGRGGRRVAAAVVGPVGARGVSRRTHPRDGGSRWRCPGRHRPGCRGAVRGRLRRLRRVATAPRAAAWPAPCALARARGGRGAGGGGYRRLDRAGAGFGGVGGVGTAAALERFVDGPVNGIVHAVVDGVFGRGIPRGGGGGVKRADAGAGAGGREQPGDGQAAARQLQAAGDDDGDLPEPGTGYRRGVVPDLSVAHRAVRGRTRRWLSR